MNINHFVHDNQLRPADAIVLKKKFMGMAEHFVIYLGNEGTEPRFVANFTKGIKILPNKEINEQIKTYVPEKIERFNGNSLERGKAVARAKSRIGEKAYGYVSNNCEHFKNWVHFGQQYSKQVSNVGTALSISGATMAVGGLLLAKPKARNWGVGILLFGVLLKSFAERNNE